MSSTVARPRETQVDALGARRDPLPTAQIGLPTGAARSRPTADEREARSDAQSKQWEYNVAAGHVLAQRDGP